MCFCVCACVYVCPMCGCPGRPNEGASSSGAEVTDGSVLPGVGARH